jgi:hypothetical protein
MLVDERKDKNRRQTFTRPKLILCAPQNRFKFILRIATTDCTHSGITMTDCTYLGITMMAYMTAYTIVYIMAYMTAYLTWDICPVSPRNSFSKRMPILGLPVPRASLRPRVNR